MTFTLSWTFQDGDAAKGFIGYISGEPRVLAEAAGSVLGVDARLISVEVAARAATSGPSSGAARRLQSASAVVDLKFSIAFVRTWETLSDSELASLFDAGMEKLVGGSFIAEVKARAPVDYGAVLDLSSLGVVSPPTIVVGAAFWMVVEWSPCSAECGTGTRGRVVECSVADSLCSSPKPDAEEECKNDSGCAGSTDDESQATVMLVVLLVGACCCYSCCLWCFWKARRVRSGKMVIRRNEADRPARGQMDDKLNVKFEIIDNPGKALTSAPSDQQDEEAAATNKQLVRWLYDGSIVDKWFAEDATTGEGAGQTPAGEPPKPEDGADANKDGGDADKASADQLAIGGAPPEAVLAYLPTTRVEYFSKTLSVWVGGRVLEPGDYRNSNNKSNNKSNAQLLSDYNVMLTSGQVRYDVGLDEIRLELQPGELVDVRCAPSMKWVPGTVKDKVSTNPTQFGYIIEVLGRDPPLTRVSPANVRRRFPAGARVQAYLGDDRGWVSGVVVAQAADPSIKDVFASETAMEHFSLSPAWRQIGDAEPNAWAMLVVKLSPPGDAVASDADAVMLAAPSFLVRTATEAGSSAGVHPPANGAPSNETMAADAQGV